MVGHPPAGVFHEQRPCLLPSEPLGAGREQPAIAGLLVWAERAILHIVEGVPELALHSPAHSHIAVPYNGTAWVPAHSARSSTSSRNAATQPRSRRALIEAVRALSCACRICSLPPHCLAMWAKSSRLVVSLAMMVRVSSFASRSSVWRA